MISLRKNIALLLLLLPLVGWGQSISPEVIGSTGESFTGTNVMLDFTIGEVIIGLKAGPNAMATNGFHQTYLCKTVLDVNPPIASCPADITVYSSVAVCDPLFSYAVIGTDDCGVDTMIQITGLPSPSNYPIGITTNTWVVYDSTGNTDTCSFVVTAVDTLDPVITCPADTILDNDPGDCGAIYSFTPTSVDNCSETIAQLTGSASGSLFPTGVSWLLFEAMDPSGNADSCSFSITVVDTQAPAIVCPSDFTYYTAAGDCDYTIPVLFDTLTDITDNCTAFIMTSVGDFGATLLVGVHPQTWIAEDTSGNSSTCMYDVIILDTISPLLTCPSIVPANNDPGLCGAVVTYSQPLVDENCGIIAPVLVSGKTTPNFYQIGTTVNLFSATDTSGNIGYCSFSVTVTDNEDPIITCRNDTTIENNVGGCTAIFSFADATATDNCTFTVAQTSGMASGSAFPNGPNMVEFTATDSTGNTDICSFTVTVTDTSKPVINCPADFTAYVGGACDVAVPNPIDSLTDITDNCGGFTITAVGSGAATFPIGSYTETWSVIDDGGNVTNCTYTISVEDSSAPFLMCPTDVITGNDPGLCGAVVTYTPPFAFDNCGVTSLLQVSGMASGILYPIGIITNVFQGMDAAGNVGYCSFSIDVSDDESPSIACPSDTSIFLNPGLCVGTYTFTMPTGWDNCSTYVSQTAGLASGSGFPIGDTDLGFTVSDTSNNIDSCSYTLTVVDSQAPVILCPSDLVTYTDVGLCSAFVASPLDPALHISDNCGTPFLPTVGSGDVMMNVGTVTETWVAMDLSGNTTTCTYTKTVLDTVAPVLNCPAPVFTVNDPGLCGAVVTYSLPTVVENCNLDTLFLSSGMGTGVLYPIGTVTNVMEGIDENGNSGFCSFTITVSDTEPVVISCPNDTLISNMAGMCSAVLNYAMPVASDNCIANITHTAGPVSGGSFSIGNTIVGFIGSDTSGNVVSCNFTVTVADTQAPSMVCPPNQMVYTDPGSCDAFVVSPFDPATDVSDNCSTPVFTTVGSGDVTMSVGTVTEIWIANDGNGNETTCTYDISVMDSVPPILSCPTNVITNNDPGLCGAVVSFSPPLYIENCIMDTIIQLSGLASGILYPIGDVVNVFEGTDVSGNSTQCSFLVSISDIEPIVITCPDDTTVPNEVGTCAAIVSFADAIAVDNCSYTMAQTSGLTSGSSFTIGSSTIEFTATDSSGVNVSCSFVITVEDTQAPVLVCPSDYDLPTNFGTCEATFTSPFNPLTDGSDNCGSPIFTTVGTVSATLPLGSFTQTWVASDLAGNVAACTFTVTVVDTLAPVLTCPADVVAPNDPGLCGAVVTYTPTLGADECSMDTIFQISGLGTGVEYPLGTTTNVFEGVDASGNSGFCSFSIHINDVEPVIVTCPSSDTLYNDHDSCGAVVSFPMAIGTDNCTTIVSQTSGPLSGSTFPIGNTMIEFSASDTSGNTSVCSFNISVIDTQAPVINCPMSFTVPTGPGVCEAFVPNPIDMGADITDNCSFWLTSVGSGDAIVPLGAIVETWVAEDPSGNTSTCIYTITVADSTPPLVTCPTNVNTVNDPGLCGAVVTFTPPFVTDVCGADTVFQIGGIDSGILYPIGTTTNTFEGLDDAGNSGFCMFTVIVSDIEPPVATCPSDTTYPADSGMCSAVVWFDSASATDNCIVSISQTAGPAPGDVFPIGISTIEFTAADTFGIFATCSFSITVADSEAPVIICPSDVVVSSDSGGCTAFVVSPLDPSADVTDNCGAPFFTTVGSGDVSFPVGTVSETWVAEDAAGNTSTCSYTITVTDSSAPVVVCPSNMNVVATTGCSAAVSYPLPTITDDCAAGLPVLISGSGSGGVYGIGTHTEVWVGFDLIGNSDTCSFEITMSDGVAPIIDCPVSPVMISASGGSCEGIANYTLSATDNCFLTDIRVVSGPMIGDTLPYGLSTVVIEAEDSSMIVSTCSFDLEVMDVDPPVFTNCPSDTTIDNLFNNCSQSFSWVAPIAIDNCTGSATVTSTFASPFGLFNVGATETVAYYATDIHGNTDSCVFGITVIDVEPPYILSCPTDTIVANTNADCAPLVFWQEPTMSDNCPTFNVVASHNSGSTFPIGVSEVLYYIDDAHGMSDTCKFNVTVTNAETIPPSIVCPADTIIVASGTACGGIASFNTPNATDNCGIPTVNQLSGPLAGDTVMSGVFVIEFEAVDMSGMTDSCSFTMTVVDTVPPVLTCPSNMVINNHSGLCGGIPTFVLPSGVDNCAMGTITQVAGFASEDTFMVGTTTNSFIGLDLAGNSGTCSFDITVLDNESPMISCPPALVLSNDSGQCGAMVSYPSAVGFDNCSATVAYLAGPVSGAFMGTGTMSVTFTAFDPTGNSTDCSFDVTVQDTEVPMIACPSNLVVSNDSGSCSATVGTLLDPATDVMDNCGSVSFSTVGSGMTIYPLGTITETWVAMDPSGNSSTCSYSITVNDNEAPVIACPSDTMVSNDGSDSTALVTFLNITASDNCTGTTPFLVAGLGNNALYPLGSTTNIYVTADGSGNVDTCSFDIMVVDSAAPMIICPGDLIVNNDAGQCIAVVVYTPPVGTDNGPAPITSLLSGVGPGGNFAIGNNVEVYQTVDSDGNVTTCSFDIQVLDNELPTIACPSDQNLIADPISCGVAASWVDPVGMDNCSNTTSQVAGPSSGSVFGTGMAMITFEVIDANGNADSCSFNISVIDTLSPEIICPANIVVMSDSGNCGALVNYPTPTGSDNCGSATVTQVLGLGSGNFFPVGTFTETYSAVDSFGNTSGCGFIITVEEDGVPQFANCPSDMLVSTTSGSCDAIVSWPTLNATDNCGIASQTSTHNSGDTFTIGQTAVIYSAVDGMGNAGTCAFNVTVEDNENPSISGCPSGTILVANDPAFCGAVVTWSSPVISDNCSGATLGGTHSVGDYFAVGTTAVTLSAMDGAGNISDCSFSVEVMDIEVPVINCPNPIITGTDSGVCGSVVTYNPPTTSDNCPNTLLTQISGAGSGSLFNLGVHIEEWQLDDQHGNVASCSFTITVEDDTPPVFTACPSDKNITTPPNSCSAAATWNLGGALDNCTTVSVLSSHMSGAPFPVGSTTVTLTATDLNGNSSICSFDVNVNDGMDPEMTCPGDITVTASPGQATAMVNYPSPVVSDNCVVGSASMVNGMVSGSQFPIGTTTNIFTVSDASGNVGNCSFIVTVLPSGGPCVQPSNLVASLLTSTSVELTWNAPGVSEVQVAWRPVGGMYTTMNLTNATSYIVTGLLPATNYEWKVKDLCNAPSSVFGWTALNDFATTGGTCLQPISLDAINLTSNTATLTFFAPGVSTSQVAYKELGAATYNTDTVFGNSVGISGLSPNTTYVWKVRDWCNYPITFPFSVHGFTGHDTFTTPNMTCAQPTAMNVTNASNTTATLNWVAPGTIDFQIAYRPVTNPTSFWSTENVSAVNSYTLSGLTPGQTYEWKIKDRCLNPGSLYGWTGSQIFNTLVGNCAQPQNLVSTVISPTIGQLAWTLSTPIPQAEVAIRRIDIPGQTFQTYITTQTNLTLNNLDVNSVYEWKVRDLCDNGVTTLGFGVLDTFITPVIRVDIGAQTEPSAGIDVYPNPVSTELSVDVELLKSQDFDLQIVDMRGKLIYSESNSGTPGLNAYKIDMSNYAKGIYFLRFISSDETMNFKVEKR